MAAIHSLDENDAVFDFLVKASLEFAWLGLHDKGVFVGQQWSDGSPVNFVRWDSGQPDSNLGQQACTIMASNGFWRDHDCESKKRYICKATIGKRSMSVKIPSRRGCGRGERLGGVREEEGVTELRI